MTERNIDVGQALTEIRTKLDLAVVNMLEKPKESLFLLKEAALSAASYDHGILKSRTDHLIFGVLTTDAGRKLLRDAQPHNLRSLQSVAGPKTQSEITRVCHTKLHEIACNTRLHNQGRILSSLAELIDPDSPPKVIAAAKRSARTTANTRNVGYQNGASFKPAP